MGEETESRAPKRHAGWNPREHHGSGWLGKYHLARVSSKCIEYDIASPGSALSRANDHSPPQHILLHFEASTFQATSDWAQQ
jgi:hypothetical protein